MHDRWIHTNPRKIDGPAGRARAARRGLVAPRPDRAARPRFWLDLSQGGLRRRSNIARDAAGAAEERAMGYKEILVTVDTASAGPARLEVAAALAERCEAHLIGLHASLMPFVPPSGGYFEHFDRSLLDQLYGEFSDRMREREEAARTLFEDLARRRQLASEWRVGAGSPAENAALHGRYVDLIVLGQTIPTRPIPCCSRRVPKKWRSPPGARSWSSRMPAGSRRAASACWSLGMRAAPRRARSTMRCRCSPRRKR